MTHLPNFPGLASIDNVEEQSEDSNILYDSKTLLFKECVQNLLEDTNKKDVDASNKNKMLGNIDKENKKSNIITQKEKKVKKQISTSKKKIKKKEEISNSFLCKKRNRNLFTTNKPKEFSVFNHGEYDHDSRKLIQEVLENNRQKTLKNANSSANAESGKIKKKK